MGKLAVLCDVMSLIPRPGTLEGLGHANRLIYFLHTFIEVFKIWCFHCTGFKLHHSVISLSHLMRAFVRQSVQ